jgi:Rrf2 family transcriptional regulator, iron-sulfur cluster assembly transcription factor
LKLSKESQAGLTGVLALARLTPGTVESVAEIAATTGLAQPFLAKVFQRLARGGILRVYRGRSRGYALARPAQRISLQEVVEAIEGPQVFRHCVFWSDTCSETQPCALHDIWQPVAERSRVVMAETSVADLMRIHAARRTPPPSGDEQALLDANSTISALTTATEP